MAKPSVLFRLQQSFKFFRGGAAALTERKEAPFRWPTWRDGKAQWHLVDFKAYAEEGFNANSLIYSAIMYKYRALRSVKMRAYTGDPEEAELAPQNSKLAELLSRPNPYMGQSAFIGLCDIYLNIAGQAPVLLDRPKLNVLPEAMYPLRPDRVFIIPDREKRGLKGYYYVPEGQGWDKGTPILPEDMMFPKFPNPMDPLEGMGYGLSPISPGAKSADVDNNVTDFLKIFFERGAMPTGILQFDTPISEEVLGNIKRRWQDQYGSYQNWTDIGVLDQGAKYERMGMTFNEMGFETLDERSEGRILSPFGVPPSLLATRMSMKTSTYANRESDRKQFWEDTMTAEIDIFEDEFRYFLRDGEEFVAFDLTDVPALRANVPALVVAWQQLVNTGVPKNAAAKVLGLELGNLPDGDVSYMPFNLVATGRGAPEVEVSEESDDLTATNDDRKALETKKGFTQEQKEAHYKRVDKIAVSFEEQFRRAARTLFEEQRREILAMLTSAKKKSVKDKKSFDYKGFLEDVLEYLASTVPDWVKKFDPILQELGLQQVEQWGSVLDQSPDNDLFRQEWFENYKMTFAQEVTDTTAKDLSAVIEGAMADGMSVPNIQEQIGATFDVWIEDKQPDDPDFEWIVERAPAHRTELIARDQTLRASNATTHNQFEEWGVKQEEWLTTLDGRERESHAAMNGTVVAVGEPFTFPDGSQVMFPGDDSLGAPLGEIIQCRCVTLPIVEGQ